MRFSKADILQMFERQGECYFLAIIAQHYLRGGEQYNPSAISEGRGLRMEVEGRWVSFSDVASKLENHTTMYSLTADFLHNQLHALIRAPFELLDDYCSDFDKATPNGNLHVRMKSADWYPFARIIRNAISHNFRFDFGKGDRKLLPVKWLWVTISENLNGQPLTDDFFAPKIGYRLFLRMQDFAMALPELPAELI
jgi:hypothetical protein